MTDISQETLDSFIEKIWTQGKELYRDLPWRNIDDPYAVLLSEVMLQQTQVKRVLGRWEQWLRRFPSVEDLASAPTQLVLEEWQGMGYNRRAINLKRAAETVVEHFDGIIPHGHKELVSLPGVGPATAAGVRVFAFQEPDMYLETNVRTVFIHELFADQAQVDDKELIPLIEKTCPQEHVRAWYYALLDYGAYLKSQMPNPSRRSKQYKKQSSFEGSHRQKRAALLRLVLEGCSTTEELTLALNEQERAAHREALSEGQVVEILEEIASEGFVVRLNEREWVCP